MEEDGDHAGQLEEVDFEIFGQRERWPAAADLIFIADAVDRLSDAIWGNDDPELEPIRRQIAVYEPPPERAGVLWTMVKMFEALLVGGEVIAHGRPVAGTGTRPLRNVEWDSDLTLSAVARGRIGLTREDGVAEELWIFLDRVEFDLLMLLYSPAGPSDDVVGNIWRRHDRLAELVRANLTTIARSRRAAHPARIGPGPGRTAAGDDPTAEEFEAMFEDAKRILEARHQIALEERMAGWLVVRFDEDAHQTLQRLDFNDMARKAFDPYYTDDYFRRAWTLAIRERPRRFRSGRPKKK